MRRSFLIASLVLAPLCLHSAFAQEPAPAVGGAAEAEMAGWTGFAAQRAQSHFGMGGPSSGAEHFDQRSYNYSTWYRPKAHEVQKYDRCVPTKFRPRGYGNLFAERETGYRMDYAPYRLTDPRTVYGPAYYPVVGDETCDCHEGRHCKSCSLGLDAIPVSSCQDANCQSCAPKKSNACGCNSCQAKSHSCNTIGCGVFHTCSSCKLLGK